MDKENDKSAGSDVNAISGKKEVAGVPAISWGATGCSFAAALEAAMTPTQHPYSYSEIMGYSGLAFRVRWRGMKSKKGDEPWWCGSVPVGEFPEEIKRVAKMTGWQLESTGMLDSQPEKIKALIPDVVKSIDGGLPVVGYPSAENMNCSVIYGYDAKDGKLDFLWRDISKGAQPSAAPAEAAGPWFLFLKSWTAPATQKERLLESLRQSVAFWSLKQTGDESYYTYSYGRAAFEIWIDDIKGEDKLSEAKRKELFFLNWWNFSTLVDARKQAVAYLKGSISLLDGEARKSLERIIDIYQCEQELLATATYKDKNAFFGSWSGKKLEDWSPEVRGREMDILAQSMKLEQEAVAEIEKLLAGIVG